MGIRLAVVEKIEPTGTAGMFMATLAVREHSCDGFHGLAVTVIGTDLTNCMQRTIKVLHAFNGD